MSVSPDSSRPEQAPATDPGWRPVLRRIPWILVPQVAIARSRREHGATGGLVLLRMIWCSFVFSTVGMGVVVIFATDHALSTGAAWFVVLAAHAGLIYGVGLRLVASPPIVGPTSADAAVQWRIRMFLRIAFASTLPLVGFVGTFVTGPWWIYYVGAGLAAPGFVRAAPSRRNLARDQRQLDRDGVAIDLVGALDASV